MSCLGKNLFLIVTQTGPQDKYWPPKVFGCRHVKSIPFFEVLCGHLSNPYKTNFCKAFQIVKVPQTKLVISTCNNNPIITLISVMEGSILPGAKPKYLAFITESNWFLVLNV